MDAMRDFYENKLGLKAKIITRAKAYKGNKSREKYAKIAEEDPNRILIIYIEIAPGAFIELFPATEGQKPHCKWNDSIGYSHFALTVDDIHKTRDELVAKGVEIDVEPNIGNSHTWQMWIHDPDGNKFEIMQYTDESYQLVGHID